MQWSKFDRRVESQGILRESLVVERAIAQQPDVGDRAKLPACQAVNLRPRKREGKVLRRGGNQPFDREVPRGSKKFFRTEPK